MVIENVNLNDYISPLIVMNQEETVEVGRHSVGDDDRHLCK